MRDEGTWSQRSLALGVAATVVTFAIAWVASVVVVRSLSGMAAGAVVGAGGGLRTVSDAPAASPPPQVPSRPARPRVPSFAMPSFEIPSFQIPSFAPSGFYGVATRRTRPAAAVLAAQRRFVADALAFDGRTRPLSFVIRDGRVVVVDEQPPVQMQPDGCVAAVADPHRRLGDGQLIEACRELVSEVAVLLHSVDARRAGPPVRPAPVRDLVRSRLGR